MGSQDNGGQELIMPQDGSIFNLTLDEVQTQLDSLGKPLSSMNLEELVITVHAADSNKVLGTDSAALQGQTNGNDRQLRNTVTMPCHLGVKTANEVCMDIQQGHTDDNCEDRTRAFRRQPTLGELTLEDFLAKAGIVAEAPAPNVDGMNPNVTSSPRDSLPVSNPWMQVQHSEIQQPPFLHCKNMVPVFMPGHHHAHQSLPITMAYPQTQKSLSSPQSAGTLSDTASVGRKRVPTGDITDKAAERRHKRMIKNRESAARSRERKQAYTQQLELRLAELEEENAKLKAAEAPITVPPDTKPQLHRTRSAPL